MYHIMTNFSHPYHLVTPSPWPFLISLSIMNNLISTISWFHKMNYYTLITFPATLICAYTWWQDVIRESTFLGFHTKSVYSGMRMGMILFIISEVFFFLSFFWAFFHSSLSPTIECVQSWPPLGITPFNPFNIPLLNTIILVSSGLTITWSHHSMLNANLQESEKALFMTLMLGGYFTFIQLTEYNESSFTISDSIYGSTFFLATGFHGLHLLIGSVFLFVCLLRMKFLHFSTHLHFGFEAATWYWHFVDVVWLFLYISIYWWGY